MIRAALAGEQTHTSAETDRLSENQAAGEPGRLGTGRVGQTYEYKRLLVRVDCELMLPRLIANRRSRTLQVASGDLRQPLVKTQI